MKLYRVGGSGVAVVMFAMSLLAASSSNAQTNSWISPASGHWEDSSWSLGQPPGPGQTILLTNAGFKAVEIRQNTAANFPQTLAVDSITISSPTNSLNTLLLNFAGVNSPLVANSLTLNANSVLTMHSSALLVKSNLSIGGTFNQNDFSGVTTANLQIGDLGPALYTLSNGTLTVTNLEFIGSSNNFPVDFDQEGGFHLAAQLWITNGAEYELRNGQFGGDVRIKHGILVQTGGDLAPNNFSIQGSYTLMDGTLEAPNGLTMSGDAFADQWGGTNSSGSLVMGSTSQDDPTGGIYTIVGGTMNLTSATINYLGDLDQQGGSINISGALNIPDFLFGPDAHFVWGNFSQEGGMFSAGSINLSGHITQSGGTNTVAGNLTLQDGPADYILSGGLLSTLNTLKNSGAFHQTNGVHSVQNLLQIDNPLGYDMAGGQLIAPFIQIDNSTFAHYGGDINNSAVLIMNFGRWMESSPSVQLGRLRVIGSGFPSTLALATNPCTVHFIGSIGQVWSNNVTLNIEGWSGSLTGGGQSQIFFGNNSSGLSAAQLAHVQFTFSQGNLPAKILPSGEIVPVVSGLPFFPTDLTATSLATNRIDLHWTDNALNEYGYSIERSLDGTNFVQLCAPPANATNYSDTDVFAGTTYYYRAQAQSTNGNSDYSNVASATTKFHPPLAGMIAWWRADGTGDDSIGTHNADLPFGASYATGKVGQAFDFPGLGARVRVPYTPDLIQTNAFTVEGWIYPRQASNGIVAMLGDFLPHHDSWALHMTNNPGHLSFVINSDVAQTAEIQAPVETNQWQHFAATFNATNGMKLYINGTLAVETNASILPVSFLNPGEEAFLSFGNASVISNYFPFLGLVDEVSLYSRDLRPDEIQSIYNAGASGKLSVTPITMALSSQTNGAVLLNFAGPFGRSFEFDISTDLVHWAPWKTQLNNSGTMLINDDSTTNAPIRFYRTILLP